MISLDWILFYDNLGLKVPVILMPWFWVSIWLISILSVNILANLILRRGIDVLVSSLLQNLSKDSHLVHLLPCVDISLKSSVGSIKNVLLLIDVISDLRCPIQLLLPLIRYILLFLQIVINNNDFLLKRLNLSFKHRFRLFHEVVNLVKVRSLLLIPFGKILRYFLLCLVYEVL